MIQNLNSQQKKVLKTLLNSKHNLFITGAAGTGKSHVIKIFREIKKMTHETIPMMASTGAASLLVNGVTFNSYFGLGILQGGVKQTVDAALKSRTVVERIVYTDCVIIDEISMISAETFMAANLLCQKIKRNKKFFGGIRVICVGDFFQLGPYSDNETPDWVFNGPCWRQAKIKKLELTQVMRTKDKPFLDILAKVRQGKVDAKVKNFLNKRLIKKNADSFNGPRIFSRNWQVDEYNQKRLALLSTPIVKCPTVYGGEGSHLQRLKENLIVPEVLMLKKGALVMMRVNNFNEGYVNGTVGTVVGIMPEVLTIKKLDGTLIHVKKHVFEYIGGSGEILARAKNFPLTLAWAITIHKSQGASIEQALVSLDKLWLHGQAYTALSRFSSSSGIYLVGWDKSSFIIDKKVLKYAKSKK